MIHVSLTVWKFRPLLGGPIFHDAALVDDAESLHVIPSRLGDMWTPPDRLLAARVAGQFGLITRAQALAGGVSRKAVACHLASERWITVHPGVYLTTPGRDDWSVTAMAALLWSGPGATLCRSSAGYAWGLVRSAPDPVEVVVPAERRVRSTAGVAVTRSRRVQQRVDPLAWPHRISAAHTVFDLAHGEPPDRAISLAARALDLRLLTAPELAAALTTRPQQGHFTVLLEALTDVAAGSESAAEVRYIRDVERAHGLPPGRRQAPVDDRKRRDVEYEEFGVIVEIDGRLAHSGWNAQQQDGRRDRRAAAGGQITVRCYWPDLVPTGCGLAMEVGAIITHRGWTGELRQCGPGCPVARGTSVPACGA